MNSLPNKTSLLLSRDQKKNQLTFWLLAARPKTLGAALVPILLAGTTAISTLGASAHLFGVLLFALISSLAIQVATNFFNDAIDFEKGADTSERLGPLRMAALGVISPRSLRQAALLALGVALLASLPLVYWGGWVIVAVGLTSLFLAYGYTGGPYPLAYHGLGELFVMLFFGFIPAYALAYLLFFDPLVIFYPFIFLNGLVAGLGSSVLIAINNFRDLEQDQRVGKKTLAVRLGRAKFLGLIFLMMGLSYLSLLGFALLTKSPVYVIGCLSLFLALPLMRDLRETLVGHAPNWASLLGRSGQWALLHGVLVSVSHLFHDL